MTSFRPPRELDVRRLNVQMKQPSYIDEKIVLSGLSLPRILLEFISKNDAWDYLTIPVRIESGNLLTLAVCVESKIDLLVSKYGRFTLQFARCPK